MSRARRPLRAALVAALLAAVAAVFPVLTANSSPAQAAPTSGGVKIAYFDQWAIYQNAFYPKNLDTGGIAAKLDYLIYDFENIDPTNLTCFEATKATDPDPAARTTRTPVTARATRSPTTRSPSAPTSASTASPTPGTSRSPATSTSSRS